MTYKKRLYIYAAVIGSAAAVMSATFPIANQHETMAQVVTGLVWGVMTGVLIAMGVVGWSLMLFPEHAETPRLALPPRRRRMHEDYNL